MGFFSFLLDTAAYVKALISFTYCSISDINDTLSPTNSNTSPYESRIRWRGSYSTSRIDWKTLTVLRILVNTSSSRFPSSTFFTSSAYTYFAYLRMRASTGVYPTGFNSYSAISFRFSNRPRLRFLSFFYLSTTSFNYYISLSNYNLRFSISGWGWSCSRLNSLMSVSNWFYTR